MESPEKISVECQAALIYRHLHWAPHTAGKLETPLRSIAHRRTSYSLSTRLFRLNEYLLRDYESEKHEIDAYIYHSDALPAS